MIAERFERRVRSREHIEAKALIKSARQELGSQQLLRDSVVIKVGGLGREPFAQAEKLLKGIVEPHPGRGSAKEVVAVGKDAPDTAWVFKLRDADFEVVEGDTLAVKHSINIVVR